MSAQKRHLKENDEPPKKRQKLIMATQASISTDDESKTDTNTKNNTINNIDKMNIRFKNVNREIFNQKKRKLQRRIELSKQTVKNLKQLCRDANIKVGGNKTQLIDRLIMNEFDNDDTGQKKLKRSQTLKSVQSMLINKYNISKTDVENGSKCLMAGIGRGFIKIDEKLGLDTILIKGKCFLCEENISCTIGDALLQPDYGGDEYEDGAESGACQCLNEDCENGHYVTGMCENRIQLDSGKFHNHCNECKGFGKCLGDYRETHCDECGSHYFCGLSCGGTCYNCQRKGKGSGNLMG